MSRELLGKCEIRVERILVIDSAVPYEIAVGNGNTFLERVGDKTLFLQLQVY